MSKPKVVVTRRWPEAVERVLGEKYDVTLNVDDVPMDTPALQEALKTADAFCPTVSDKIDAEVLGVDNPKTQIIGNFGVGFNHIDLDAARKQNFVVTNTPEVLTDCTADIAIMLLMMVSRRAVEGDHHVRDNQWTGWRPTHMMGTKVTGKTIGLVGFGRIARAMAHKAHFGFGMKVLFHDPYPPSDELVNFYGATECSSLDEMLGQSDFVSLHCPGGDATYHLMNSERFDAMRSDAFLINTARGDVVDNASLLDALKTNKIAGAGLDVYEGEPAVPEELKAMNNVVLLPHLGSATNETRVAMGMRVVENLDAFFAGKTPRDRVV